MSSSAHISGLSEVEHRRMLTRAAFAATIGTTIEWYDFFLYGTATGLVFGALYFPNQDPLVARWTPSAFTRSASSRARSARRSSATSAIASAASRH